MINSVPFGLHPSRKTIYFNNTITTSGMHLSRRTYVPLFLQTVKNIYFSSTRPRLVPSIPEKTLQVFRIFKTDLNMKYISKLPDEKGYVNHPERILDDTFELFTVLHNGRKYCLPFTVSSPWPQIINLKIIR